MDIQKRNLELSLYNNRYLLDKIFFKDNKLEFIFKKTEKVCMAVYLLTNFFVPEEPLKWSLRKSANEVLNSILSYNSSSLSLREKNLMDLHSGILNLVSYFDLAFNSGFVSEMNYQIMAREINDLIKQIEIFDENSFGANKKLFDENYFKVEDIPEDRNFNLKDNNYKGAALKDNFNQRQNNYNRHYYGHNGQEQNINQINNGQNKFTNNTSRYETNSPLDNNIGENNNSQITSNNKPKPKPRTTNLKRQEKIIAEIKKHESVSIKDILRVLPNYSSKTLQRELIRMVDEGILEKTGERRWSRYSLKTY